MVYKFSHFTVAGVTITAHPVDQLDQVPGTAVTFTVMVTEGAQPVSYLWLKDGLTIMADPAKYTGLTTTVLTVHNVQEADEGNYGLYAFDRTPVFSGVARLTVCKLVHI